MIQFGCCLPGASFVPQVGDESRKDVDPIVSLQEGLRLLKNHGYDFAELTVGTIANLSEEDFKRAKETILSSGINVPVYNSFVPPHIKLTGPDISHNKIKEYLELAITRVSEAGGEYIIFGSGGARSYPEDFPKEEAMKQIEQFLSTCNDYAAKNNVIIAIEPLNKKESNVINQVREGVELARRLQLSHIKVLADSYHMIEENESYTILPEAVEENLLAHVHIADRNRVFPGLPVEDGMDFTEFFKVLQQCQYSGRISAECRVDNFASESKDSLQFVRNTWESVSGVKR